VLSVICLTDSHIIGTATAQGTICEGSAVDKNGKALTGEEQLHPAMVFIAGP